MGPQSPPATGTLLAMITQRSKRFRPVPIRMKESGDLPRKPRAVLFDVYGTLLARIGDSHPHPASRQRAVEELIRRHSLPATVPELSASLASAIDREHAELRARGNANPEVAIERIWAEIFPDRQGEELQAMIVEYELATHPAWPMPGCGPLLRHLRDLGVALGIVSNAQFYTPLFLQALLGASLEDLGFASDLCLFSWRFGTAKPDPGLFALARQKLHGRGLREEEAVMVGNDASNDVEPAARSGFMTVLAALDSRSFQPASGESPQPDAVIRRLRSLKRLVSTAE
jgi:putative hydrolase of the HAD superfamily